MGAGIAGLFEKGGTERQAFTLLKKPLFTPESRATANYLPVTSPPLVSPMSF